MYERYCRLRDGKGVRDADVAKATGISQVTFSEWKHGRYAPKADKLQKIADYFGVSLDYLQTGEVKETYYTNPETAKVAQEIAENRELAMLFDAAMDVSPEALKATHDFLMLLKRMEKGQDD